MTYKQPDMFDKAYDQVIGLAIAESKKTPKPDKIPKKSRDECDKLGLKPGSQSHMIASYLHSGGTLTQLDALGKFRCMRLGARILDIKQAIADAGLPWFVHSEIIVPNRNQKRVARYSMEVKPNV